MKEKVTSTDIKRALAEKHWRDFFLTEVKSGPTQLAVPGGLKILDGLAIRKSWTAPCFTGYEVKISRSDFLRDAKFYTYEELCNCLYIVCPKGMIERTELPESVGLMYYDPEKKTITTRKKAIFRKIEYSPELLLYIIFSRLDSDRYPFFSTKQEYFKEYLAGKRDNRELAQAVKTKLVQDNARLESELGNVEAFRQNYEIYKAVQDVMHKHGIWIFRASDAAKELDKALTRKCPEDISSVRQSLEGILYRLKRMEEAGEKTGDGKKPEQGEG
ncbi:hypothetical protein [uncultured Oscillibacter sp.]|uniref:hypothetical protein n=1 Tax=uncultured Oscillibacter sp. TaxID=876091 RepID=UPI0025EB8897|nr:hypothetical protein [uncultured Oscillibacter sp.]